MRAKIQKSMLFIICVTLVVTFLLLTMTYYVEQLNGLKEDLKQDTFYAQDAFEKWGQNYLNDLGQMQSQMRVTLIEQDGGVLYDSKEDENTLENHAGRKEIKEAFLKGYGEAIRTSKTVGKTTIYCAVLLENGMVLRMSKTMDSLIPTMTRTLPYISGIAVGMVIFAYYASKWQTRRLIAPINEIDLEHPLDNSVYEELNPLLIRIDEQNKEKAMIANLRKEFSANVSHELKTPLTSISGYAEIMKSGLVKEEDMVAFSERIYNEASRLISLIGDIIKLSKLDEEQVELDREWVDLYGLTKDICNRLSLLADKRKIKISLHGEETKVYGVHQILEEMIYNICENAIKYNRENGDVIVRVEQSSKEAKVSVQDTGIGIPKDVQERIFERFFRVDKSHSKETEGTGLGLSIVKHGAIYHHAEINVESELGKGTKMELVFKR